MCVCVTMNCYETYVDIIPTHMHRITYICGGAPVSLHYLYLSKVTQSKYRMMFTPNQIEQKTDATFIYFYISQYQRS